MFAEKFTSPAFDIISALSVAGAVTFMVNELYRKPQIEKLNAFHAKLRRCRQQGIFDRAKV